MKQIRFLLAVVTIGCAACNNTTTTTTTITDSTSATFTTDPKRDFFVLDSVLKQFETPAQHLKASYAHPMVVRGAHGTVISVNPDDLTTVSGKPFSASIDIELKELTNVEELMRNRAATVSDGKLLVSGGAYYINLTCAGEQVKLKPGKSLKVQFPKITNNAMSFFYGQKDSLGQMNWKPANPSQTNNDPSRAASERKMGGGIDTIEAIFEYADSAKMTSEEKQQNELSKKVYYEISIQNFGWINCDYFWNTGNLTTLNVVIDPADTFGFTLTYLAFRDINSMMQGYFTTSLSHCVFPNIPVGSKVELLAISLKNGKTYTYRSDIAIAANQNITIKLKETPDKDVSGLFTLNK